MSCLGHGDERVKAAVMDQMDKVAYCHSLFYGTDAVEELARELVETTGGEMGRAFFVSSGEFFFGVSLLWEGPGVGVGDEGKWGMGWDDGLTVNRQRGYGGRDEDGTAVLSRGVACGTEEGELHC